MLIEVNNAVTDIHDIDTEFRSQTVYECHADELDKLPFKDFKQLERV